ncbi:MAG: ubiquinol-cytochrome C chaperone [Rhizobiales bacterium]|jgi:cytochrome b pre-mRNA-processing protein 3|nr:ubiquinol-cytochrome C chaperone [Hyphomicrobiales bacterium]
MISFPFRRSKQDATIDALYGMIVAQARSPSFYRDYAVPDTVTGRLDMIVLHLVLVLRRMKERGGTVQPAGQQLFDRFCRDIDDNFREMGVGDLAVPKKMRRVAEDFYGRAQAYESALGNNDAAVLEAAVARNIFGAPEPTPGARRLAAYIRKTAAAFDRRQGETLTPVDLEFLDPKAVPPSESEGEKRS